MPSTKGPVLVVDDDADIREAIRDALEQEGHTVAEVRDGSDALNYLQSNPWPPLILLDWNMAPMNAPQFMEEFAKHPAFGTIPVVLLTADARADEKAKIRGFVSHLRKPVKLDTLLAVVSRYCS